MEVAAALEDLDDVGGLFAARTVRSTLGDRLGHLGDTAGPRRPAKGRANESPARSLAIRPELDARVEVLEAAEREGRVVAVELDAAGVLRRPPDVEARVSRRTAPPSSSMAATMRSGLPIRKGAPSTAVRSGLSSQPHARTERAGPSIVVTSVSG